MPTSSRAKESIWPPIFFPFLSLYAFPIRIFELGPVQTGRPPPVEGGKWESESPRVFNTRQESGNGTRELRTGSRSVIRDWGPRWKLAIVRVQTAIRLRVRLWPA